MDLPEARQRKNLLFDFYEVLLTPRQREVFSMHFMEDASLTEIGEAMGTSPQAVADMLKRTQKRLEYYDGLLGLVEKHDRQQTEATRIKHALDELSALNKSPESAAIITQIRRRLDTLFA